MYSGCFRDRGPGQRHGPFTLHESLIIPSTSYLLACGVVTRRDMFNEEQPFHRFPYVPTLDVFELRGNEDPSGFNYRRFTLPFVQSKGGTTLKGKWTQPSTGHPKTVEDLSSQVLTSHETFCRPDLNLGSKVESRQWYTESRLCISTKLRHPTLSLVGNPNTD